ncbi:hypothetical protein MYK68_05790 [Gordonia sp. PP30]|uniref:hypothetical protein n=1 Tax=Gordonia sp. PP30 TaxID=2935861 RepID=UPI001FFE76D7|nr:hypothetical protein [Gordonia sp. PP30]UQE76103.1 hypothetical protein MYK68_05790 [Gordonia sp. PP30]
MGTELRLDAAALDLLVARQFAIADALDGCAQRLRPPLDWARTPAHREVAGTLERRLDELSARIGAAGRSLAVIALTTAVQAATVTETDTPLPAAGASGESD